MREKTKIMIEQIKNGTPLPEIARCHGVSRQYVYSLKDYYLSSRGRKAFECKQIFSRVGKSVNVNQYGQIVIPKIVREKLGIKGGDMLSVSLSFDDDGEQIIIMRRRKNGD